jgi:hypothetical protein
MLVQPAPDDTPFVFDQYAKWEFGKDRVPIRHLEQILPPDFIAKLERERIGTQLLTSTNIIAVVDAEMNPILSFELMRGSRPTALRIESLNGSDPTNRNLNRVKQRKQRRGLNAELFRYARDRLVVLGKAAGFTSLEGHGTADYLVNLLYRRVGHLEATSDFGRHLFRDLDSAFLSASKFPEPFRVRDLNHFSESLGLMQTDPPGYREIRARLDEILAGRPSRGWKSSFLGENAGRPLAIGAVSPEGVAYGPFFLFTTPEGKTDIVTWRALSACCSQQLILRSAEF